MATVIKQRNRFRGAGRFLSEVWGELKKVQWPTRDELYAFTIMVIIAIVAVGVYVGLLDVVLSRASDTIFRLGGS
jgi:preprotein translocase subunit SecE